MTKKILHIGSCDKFIPSFIQFIQENFVFEDHLFLLTKGMSQEELVSSKNINLAGTSKAKKIKHYSQVLLAMHRADKIILHGLFDIRIVQILFFTPWLLKRCYWIIWGGDLYAYQSDKRHYRNKIKEFFRRPVIKNMGHLVTYIEGDVDLVRQWYKAEGRYHKCLMYPSNIYKEYIVPKNRSSTINIQVGNSADPINNHATALKKLLPHKDKNIRVFAPLSYGNKKYADKVVKQGKIWFGKKFIPLTNFMPFDEYLNFLSKIDIAIFNHNRQQAMGNTITLLGLGKTVYMRSSTTQWQLFNDNKIKVFDINYLKIFEKRHTDNNIRKVKNIFSEEKLIMQYTKLFA